MVELAKAYVQIIPSMRGSQTKITSELKGLASSSGVSGAGKKIGTGLVSAIGKTMKVGLVAGATSTGAVMGAALTKGFGRLRAFEQAEQSLKGMGLAASEVAVVMENANAAVDGTAYGLDAAATAAKSMVAAGVEPGEELERVLTLVGDSAAQAGVGFDEMGVIWSKVFAKGKLQGDEAMQLMEAGIPIYQLVADQMGITAEEAMELGRKGKISADMFATAIESKFGGSALAMGDTVTGSFQNVGAALGRLGQAVLKGPFNDLPTVFTEVKNRINAVTPAVEKVAARMYESTKLMSLGIRDVLSGKNFSANLDKLFGAQASRVVGSLQTVRNEARNVRESFRGFGTAVAREFRPLTSLNLTSVLDGFDRVVQLGSTVTQKIAGIGTSLMPVVGNFGEVAAILGGAGFRVLEEIAPNLLDLADAAVQASGPITGLLVPAAQAFTSVAIPIAEVIGDVAGVLADVPAPVLAAGTAFVTMKSGLGPLPALLSKIDTGKIASGMETLALQALYAKDGLGQIAGGAAGLQGVFKLASGALGTFGKALKGLMIANAPLLAITAVVTVLSALSAQSQKTEEHVDSIADSFDELGQVTDRTVDALYSILDDDDLPARFEAVGIGADELIASFTDGEEATARFRERLAEMEAVAWDQLIDGEILQSEYNEIKNLGDAYDKQADKYFEAGEAAKKAADAKAVSIKSDRDAVDAIEKVIDAEKRRQDQLLGVADKALAARGAQRDFNSAVADAAAVMQDAEASADDKQAALDRVAEATMRNVTAARENKASQEELDAIVRQGKDAFYEQAAAANMSTSEISALWAEIGLNPGVVKTEMDVVTDAAWLKLGELQIGIDSTSGLVTIDGNPVPAETKLSELEGAIDNGDGTVTINGDSYPADKTLDDYVASVNGSAGTVEIGGESYPADQTLRDTLAAIRAGKENVTIGGRDFPAKDVLAKLMARVRGSQAAMQISAVRAANFGSVLASMKSQINQQYATIKVGTSKSSASMSYQADGSVLEFFGAGGLRESHVAQIAPAGAWRVWAEPETGGEAYIPLALSKRARSIQILAEVADRFGYQLERYADGGLAGMSSGVSAAGFPRSLVLQVDGREFTAYVKEKAGEMPGVAAASDFVAHHGRYSRMGG